MLIDLTRLALLYLLSLPLLPLRHQGKEERDACTPLPGAEPSPASESVFLPLSLSLSLSLSPLCVVLSEWPSSGLALWVRAHVGQCIC